MGGEWAVSSRSTGQDAYCRGSRSTLGMEDMRDYFVFVQISNHTETSRTGGGIRPQLPINVEESRYAGSACAIAPSAGSGSSPDIMLNMDEVAGHLQRQPRRHRSLCAVTSTLTASSRRHPFQDLLDLVGRMTSAGKAGPYKPRAARGRSGREEG